MLFGLFVAVGVVGVVKDYWGRLGCWERLGMVGLLVLVERSLWGYISALVIFQWLFFPRGVFDGKTPAKHGKAWQVKGLKSEA